MKTLPSIYKNENIQFKNNNKSNCIVKEYEKFKKKLDIFHVAFSGGKDSAVLLDLVKKALPKGSFVVIFGDTGMEFPDTYDAVEITRQQCEIDGTPFYTAKSHFDSHDSWEIFGPPARVLRWCCSVHKSNFACTIGFGRVGCYLEVLGMFGQATSRSNLTDPVSIQNLGLKFNIGIYLHFNGGF